MATLLEGRGLGRLPDPIDTRDYLAADRALRGAPKTIPNLIDWSRRGRTGPILNQGQTPSCVAHGCGTIKTFLERKDHRRTYLWAVHEFYRRCKLRDGIPDAPGTYPRVALDLMLNEGIGRDRRDYDREAGKYRIASYQRLLTVGEMEQALVLAPIVVGIDWASNWTGRTTGVLPEPTGWAGGHLIAFVGLDRPNRLFKIQQSWGEDAHDGGFVYIRYVELERQLALPTWRSADAWGIFDLVTP